MNEGRGQIDEMRAEDEWMTPWCPMGDREKMKAPRKVHL